MGLFSEVTAVEEYPNSSLVGATTYWPESYLGRKCQLKKWRKCGQLILTEELPANILSRSCSFIPVLLFRSGNRTSDWLLNSSGSGALYIESGAGERSYNAYEKKKPKTKSKQNPTTKNIYWDNKCLQTTAKMEMITRYPSFKRCFKINSLWQDLLR